MCIQESLERMRGKNVLELIRSNICSSLVPLNTRAEKVCIHLFRSQFPIFSHRDIKSILTEISVNRSTVLMHDVSQESTTQGITP